LWKLAGMASKELDLLQQGRGGVNGVAFSPDGTALAAASNQSITLWRLGQPKPAEMAGLRGSAAAVPFSPDGKSLVCGSNRTNVDDAARSVGTIRLFDRRSDQWDERWPRDECIGCGVAFAPDDSTLASGGLDGAVRLWSFREQPPAAPFLLPGK